MNVSIRKLDENDWREFREIRLKALKSDPQVFGSNYEKESAQNEDDWKEPLKSDNTAIFMLFDGETPIGMTSVSVFREDPTNKTAIFWGSWLAPEYRGKGLSEMMYKSRIEWAKDHPTIERLIVSHRASNLASKRANQKHGFKFTKAKEKVWVDGATEDEVCYEKLVK